MPKIEINKPELIWPGKYDEDGNRAINRGVALPFQIIETIREGRATREPGRTADLFSYATPADDGEWKNKLIWGDNLLVMASLLPTFGGKFDFIYIDPPFATGQDFTFTTTIGEAELEVTKQQSLLEEKAYRDTWGRGVSSYLEMMQPRIELIHQLLSAKGTLAIHCDWHVNYYIRALLDEVFGTNAFINEIVWHYFGFKRKTAKNFPRKHDTILLYGKSDERLWEVQFKPHRPEYVARFKKDKDGRLYRDDVNPTGGGARKIYLDEVEGDIVDSVWDDIPPVNPVAKERYDYATQKPEALIERLVKACTSEDSLVGDFFIGAGTTLAVAEKFHRRWIGCDLGRFAIHTTRKRLLDIDGCKPFETLNLGQYERKYWQGVSFGDQKPSEPNAAAVTAYVRFILDLYRAQSVPGTHIHGRKGAALVHVGAVDAPVTIREVNDAVGECVALKQKELHVLGWEWEMGLHDPLTQSALHEHGVRLRLLNIPREVMEKRAVEAGDIRFFDLAHLEAELEQDAKHPREVTVKLKNFVIPDTDLIPDEVREKIRKWSDYIDYWAVDWDFKHDTFMNAWQTYRTRQNRKLALVSDAHEYKAAGRYLVLIKVVDIFGNDTSRLLECKVK